MISIAPVCAALPSTSRAAEQARAPSSKNLAFRKVATSVGAAAVLLSVATAPVLAADLKLGAEVFANNCATCHRDGGNSVRTEKTLQATALKQYLLGGNHFDVESIITQVNNGGNGMPSWEGILEEEEIVAVANYVFDQASGNKW